MLTALASAEAVALGRDLDPEDVPYARARLWDERAGCEPAAQAVCADEQDV